MKKTIHPKYEEAKYSCICGNSFTVGSTKPQVKIEICSQCHPFFTGEQRFVDTAGRVDKIKKKYANSNYNAKPQKEEKTESNK